MVSHLRKDESNKLYNNWVVIAPAEPNKQGKARWLLRCNICNQESITLGRSLRKGILPKHKCIRVCKKCKRSENTTKFPQNRKVGNICLDCKAKSMIDWRNKNKLDIKKKKKYWDSNNLEKRKEYRKSERSKTENNHELFIRKMFRTKIRTNKYRKSKDGKELPPRIITISEDELVALWGKQGGRCAITNMEMLHEFNNPRTVSIDRIDSGLGYISGNVQLVCRWVNLAKNSFGDSDIRAVLREFKES